MVFNLMQTIFNSNLLFAHCAFYILFIGQDEDRYFFQMLIDDDFEELCLGNHLIFNIGAINDKYDAIGTSVVCLPDTSHSFLTA